MLIRQVVMNLLSNGIKYTDRGAVTLSLREAHDARLGRVARIAVRDTGIGIRPEDRERLFQQFTPLDGEPGRRVGGTGLGLFLAGRMTRLHGGRIDVESEPGAGSEFAVLLPLDAAPEPAAPPAGLRPEAAHPTPPGPARRPGSEGMTILCVDDEPDVLKYLKLTFEDAGYDVLLAAGHDEAIAGARAARPDLICLDLAMPGKDGYQVLRSLRADPDLARVPVVVVSVAADEAQRLAQGARRYLPKPVAAEDLLAAVCDVLGTEPGDVLIVDDDPDSARLLAGALSGQGLHVRVASDGREGLERLAEQPPSLIVLDLIMPVMNGFEFLERVQLDPQWGRIPVVVLTAKPLDAVEAERLRPSCSTVLTKGRDDAEGIVATILRSARPRPAAPREVVR